MTEITWGPEIAVDGKRPAWLGEDCKVDLRSISGARWYSDGASGLGIGTEHIGWKYVRSIRLPADHPHYASTTPQAPDLTARMEALVRRIAARVLVPGNIGEDMLEARAIVTLLPEPVDGDLILARQIVKDTLKPEDHQRCDCRDKIDAGEWDNGQKVRIALAALKHPRGRALEKGETA